MQIRQLETTLRRCKNIDRLIRLRLDYYAAPIGGNNIKVQSSRTVFEEQVAIEQAEKDGVYAMLWRIRHDFNRLWAKLSEHERTFVDFYYWQGRTIETASDEQMYAWRKKIIKKVKPLLLTIQGEFAYYDAYQTEFERIKEGFEHEKKNYNSKFATVNEQCFETLDRNTAARVRDDFNKQREQSRRNMRRA